MAVPPKQTPAIIIQLSFGQNEYGFELIPTADERFLIKSESQKYAFGNLEAVSDWTVYHFHDTSASARMRRSEIVQDNKRLRPDAANIAPFLLMLKNRWKTLYREIVDTIRLITPFFDDFMLEPIYKGDKETVNLTWQQKGSDYPLQPYHFSDGTIRFICLATVLLQPNPPSTIVIDEPELGYHHT